MISTLPKLVLTQPSEYRRQLPHIDHYRNHSETFGPRIGGSLARTTATKESGLAPELAVGRTLRVKPQCRVNEGDATQGRDAGERNPCSVGSAAIDLVRKITTNNRCLVDNPERFHGVRSAIKSGCSRPMPDIDTQHGPDPGVVAGFFEDFTTAPVDRVLPQVQSTARQCPAFLPILLPVRQQDGVIPQDHTVSGGSGVKN